MDKPLYSSNHSSSRMDADAEEITKLQVVVRMLSGDNTIDMKEVLSACPLCAQNNRKGSLKRFHISINESTVLCDNDLCWYDGDNEDIHTDSCLSPLNISGAIPSDDQESMNALDNILNDNISTPSMPDSDSKTTEAIRTTPIHAYTTPTSSPSNNLQTERNAHVTSKSPPIAGGQTSLDNLVNNSDEKVSDPFRMLWANTDALCWLDVLLGFLCFNTSVRSVSRKLPYSSVIKKLLVAYDEAQALIEPLQKGDNHILHSVMAQEKLPRTIKLGGGFNSPFTDLFKELIKVEPHRYSTKDMCSAQRKIHLADLKMEAVREEIWQVIEPALKCQRGKDDSPVFAFPLILKTDEKVMSLFKTAHTWRTKCEKCGHSDSMSDKKPMITFPKVAKEFVMYTNMVHTRSCIQCGDEAQKRELNLDRCTDNLAMHFADGLPSSDIDSLSFTLSNGARYVVTAVIEYKTSPNHFALWQKEHPHEINGKWMVYDDLRSQYANFTNEKFTAPSNNIHVVFWEKLQAVKPVPAASALPDASSDSDESFLEVPVSSKPAAKQKLSANVARLKSKPKDFDSFESAMDQLSVFSPERPCEVNCDSVKPVMNTSTQQRTFSIDLDVPAKQVYSPSASVPTRKVIKQFDNTPAKPEPNVIRTDKFVKSRPEPKEAVPIPVRKLSKKVSSTDSKQARQSKPRKSVQPKQTKGSTTSKTATGLSTNAPTSNDVQLSTTNSQQSKSNGKKSSQKSTVTQASNSSEQTVPNNNAAHKDAGLTEQASIKPPVSQPTPTVSSNMNQTATSNRSLPSKSPAPNIIDMLESVPASPTQQDMQPSSAVVRTTDRSLCQPKAKPRQLKLLSKKISAPVRPSATQSSGDRSAQPVSQGSYNDIMNRLAGVKEPKRVNNAQKPAPKLTKVATAGSAPPTQKVNKSYLDLVQPLLVKSKLEKEKMYGGYVSRKERQGLSPARKKVKFDEPAPVIKKADKKSRKKLAETKTPESIVGTSSSPKSAAKHAVNTAGSDPLQHILASSASAAAQNSTVQYISQQLPLQAFGNVDSTTWQTNNYQSNQMCYPGGQYNMPGSYQSPMDPSNQQMFPQPQYDTSGQVNNNMQSMLSFLEAPLSESQDMPSLDDMLSEFM